MDVFAELSKAIEHLACAIDRYAETQWPLYKTTTEADPWWNQPVVMTPTPDGNILTTIGNQVIESGMDTSNLVRLPG